LPGYNEKNSVTIYLIIVFVFLLMRMAVAASNWYLSPKLQKGSCKSSAFVSILIPARNEERNLGRVLDSILLQSYQNYEVIILDDGSDDRTYAIAAGYAAKYDNFKVLKGNPLPQGWTGKNFACYQLAKIATGDFLLFIDADVELSCLLLDSALTHAADQQLCLLSLFPNQQMQSIGEKSVVPLMNFMLLTLLPIPLICGHRHPVFSAACGQFMLFEAANYHKHQFHYTARAEVTEDLKIMKLVKQSGCMGDARSANGLISCRMYHGYTEAVEGFSKNFITPFNDSIFLFLCFLLTVISGPLAAIATGNIYLILAMLSIVIITRVFTSRVAGESTVYNLLLHPFQMASLFFIGCMAIYKQVNVTGEWKGRPLPPIVSKNKILPNQSM
jgi:glycosyltransferase involved in cell wall biosynthesis